MFRAANGWGISPSEFWGMTLAEWYEIAEMHIAQQGVAGTSITEERLDEIESWSQKVKENRMKQNGNS